MDRKRLVRLVIQQVIVDAKRLPGQVWYQIHWQTGAISEHRLTRQVHRYEQYAQRETVQPRVEQLHALGTTDAAIASVLNAAGFRTARGREFTGGTVWLLRCRWRISSPDGNSEGYHPLQWTDGTYSVTGVAKTVGVIMGTVYKWLRQGRLKGQQSGPGLPWKIPLTDSDIVSLRDYVQRVRRIKRSKMEAV